MDELKINIVAGITILFCVLLLLLVFLGKKPSVIPSIIQDSFNSVEVTPESTFEDKEIGADRNHLRKATPALPTTDNDLQQLEKALREGNPKITPELVKSHKDTGLIRQRAEQIIADTNALITESGLSLTGDSHMVPVASEYKALDSGLDSGANDIATQVQDSQNPIAGQIDEG